MIAPYRDSEITFYEELGIAPGATAEEIRDAFRLNVRLLHPDQQTDPQLKEIAERQMRKLNRIYAVLSDPESRREYDAMRDEDYSLPIILNTPSPAVQQLTARLAWVAAIVVSAGLLIWLASDSTPAVQSHPADAAGSTISAASANLTASDQAIQSSPELARLRADLRAMAVERDAAIYELNRLRGTPQDQKPAPHTQPAGAEPRPPVTITELPSAPRPSFTASLPAPRAERPANRPLAGFWFYTKPPQGQINKNQALYPPEYIEATITEDGSVVHGSFRARFLIVDRPISPDVNFTFTGTANGLQVSCPWIGTGGAKGDLTLRLTSENSLRIDWSASELGTLGLNAGTAVLTRRIE
jgi:curved DNA-binding protein CbpA